MKTIATQLITLFLLATLLLLSSFGDPKCKKVSAARCTGARDCRACTTCGYCKYCNSGGVCGVCSPNSFKSPAKKQETPVKTQPKPQPAPQQQPAPRQQPAPKQKKQEAEKVWVKP